MRTPRRGLRDLKTHAGVVGAATQSKARHAVCLKIATLELHKERLRNEMLAAELRTQDIAARTREINVEIEALQCLLQQTGDRIVAAGIGGGAAGCGKPRTTGGRTARTLRY